MRTTCVVAIAMMAAWLTGSAYGAELLVPPGQDKALWTYLWDDFESYPATETEPFNIMNSKNQVSKTFWSGLFGSIGGVVKTGLGVNGSNGWMAGGQGNSIRFDTMPGYEKGIMTQYPLVIEYDALINGADLGPQTWITTPGGPVSSTHFSWYVSADAKQLFSETTAAVGLKTGSALVPPDLSYNGPISYGIPKPAKALHFREEHDLLRKKVAITLWDIDQPDNKKTLNFTHEFEFIPQKFCGYAVRATAGFDNLRIYVPEPASMGLLAVGGLLLRWRRRSA